MGLKMEKESQGWKGYLKPVVNLFFMSVIVAFLFNWSLVPPAKNWKILECFIPGSYLISNNIDKAAKDYLSNEEFKNYLSSIVALKTDPSNSLCKRNVFLAWSFYFNQENEKIIKSSKEGKSGWNKKTTEEKIAYHFQNAYREYEMELKAKNAILSLNNDETRSGN